MNCCHCFRNAFTTIDGTAVCLSCHTDFQNLSHTQVSSAHQAQRGMDVANSIFNARNLQRNQNTEQQISITINGGNSGPVQAGINQTQNNNTGTNTLPKSGNDNISWLAIIIDKGIQVAKFCLRLIGFFSTRRLG